MNKKSEETKIIVLGGLGEVGKNMYCVMHGDEIIVIDAGVSFAEGELLGIDYVLPDYSFLTRLNEAKDSRHYLLHTGMKTILEQFLFYYRSVAIPAIYAPKQAKELIALKLQDRNIRYDHLYAYDETHKS